MDREDAWAEADRRVVTIFKPFQAHVMLDGVEIGRFTWTSYPMDRDTGVRQAESLARVLRTRLVNELAS